MTDDITPRLAALRVEMVGFAYRMLGSAAGAEDAAQETLVRAWRHAGRYDAARGSLRADRRRPGDPGRRGPGRARRAARVDPAGVRRRPAAPAAPAALDAAARRLLDRYCAILRAGDACRGARLVPAAPVNGSPAAWQIRASGPFALLVLDVSGGLITGPDDIPRRVGDEFRPAGAYPLRQPPRGHHAGMPWGERVGHVRDPDGNALNLARTR